MKEKTLFRCNIILIILVLPMIVSSILLESLHGEPLGNISSQALVWIHVVVSLVFVAACGYHVYLHWGYLRKWGAGFKLCKSKPTRFLVCIFIIVLVTGLISTFRFMDVGHTGLGGVHGKIGFVAAIVAVLHFRKRFSWFSHRRNGKAFAPQINYTKCVSCGKCMKGCPANVFEKDGKRVIATRPEYCRQCMKCVEHCTKDAIKSA